MGPTKFRGLGSGMGGGINAAPTAPSNGSGGEGSLNVGPLNFSAAASEVGDVMTGRITLGMVNLTIVAMLAFYIWTRGVQGGG